MAVDLQASAQFSVRECVPAVVSAPVLTISIAIAFWFDCGFDRASFLFFLDMGEDSAEAFVFRDCGMRDALLVRIEDAAGQGHAFCAHLDPAICELVGIDVFADQAAREIIDLQSDALAVVLQRQISGHIAFVAQTEDFGEAIRFNVQSAVQVVWLRRSFGEPGVIALDKVGQERVAIIYV